MTPLLFHTPDPNPWCVATAAGHRAQVPISQPASPPHNSLAKNLVQRILINIKWFSKFGQHQVAWLLRALTLRASSDEPGNLLFYQAPQEMWFAPFWGSQLWAPISDCCREAESVLSFRALFTFSLLTRVRLACFPFVKKNEMSPGLVLDLEAQSTH